MVGITRHPDLIPAELPRQLDAVSGFLRELAQCLRHTEIHVLIDTGDETGVALAAAASAIGLSIEAAAAGAKSSTDRADTLVRRPSLLLALWDGGGSAAVGDTADVVARFLGVRAESNDSAKTFEIATMLDDADLTAQIVYWVPAPRSGAQVHAQATTRPPCYLLGIGDDVLDTQTAMPSSLRRRLADLDEFNFEYERCSADGSLVQSGSLMDGVPADLLAQDGPVLMNIDRQYVKADSLASHMQWRSDRLFNLFGLMTLTMGLAYLIYDKVTESRLLLIAYMSVMFLSLLAYYYFQEKRWFGKHLSYRALAETLRVRFYLAIAGLDHRAHTGDLIALSGIHRFRGFSWIGYVLDTLDSPSADAGPAETYLRRGRFVEEAWIDAQYRYFLRKVAQMERTSRKVKRLKNVMFAAALIDISAMFLFGEALHHVDKVTGLPIKNVLTLCSGLIAVVLGVWELRQNKMATRELLWQYRNQLSQFARVRAKLRRTTNRRFRDSLIMELGDNSLMETYLWAIHRYHREHAPPTLK